MLRSPSAIPLLIAAVSRCLSFCPLSLAPQADLRYEPSHALNGANLPSFL